MSFSFRPRAPSASGSYFDVLRQDQSHPVATVAITTRRSHFLQVVDPAHFYRIDGVISGPGESELLEWLARTGAVNAALAAVGAGPISGVSWTESVRVHHRG